jgi:Zn-dependent membrane protease YugP
MRLLEMNGITFKVATVLTVGIQLQSKCIKFKFISLIFRTS